MHRAVGTHCQSGEVHSGDKLESGVDSKENLESEKVLLESDRVTDEKEDSLTSFVNDKVGLVYPKVPHKLPTRIEGYGIG